MGGDDHGGPAADASVTSWPRRVRAPASRPAWGSSSNQSSGDRATNTARATRRRCPAESFPRAGPQQPAGQAEPVAGGRDPIGRATGGPDGEPDILPDGQVVVEVGGMGEEPDSAPEGRPLTDGVEAEHRDPTRGRCHQPRTQPQQAGLPGAVRALRPAGSRPWRPRGRRRQEAGNRPDNATASWSDSAGGEGTAGAIGRRPCYGRRGARSQAGSGGRSRPPGPRSAGGQATQMEVVQEPGELGRDPAQVAGHQQEPEDDQDRPRRPGRCSAGGPGPGPPCRSAGQRPARSAGRGPRGPANRRSGGRSHR